MPKLIMAIALLLTFSFSFAQAPSVEVFKNVFYNQMQKLLPTGFTKRSISFVNLTPGKPTGGYYPFKVTAYIHDYGPGYPANRYYGQTCLGKMDGWKFDLLKDAFGEWIVQGRFTVTDSECKDNPSENTAAIAIPGQVFVPGKQEQFIGKTASPDATSQLYIGEYACYGTGGRLMAGMGFILLPNGKYYDVEKRRGGTYKHNPQKATIQFEGGFLSGQQGTGVKSTGFKLSNTVYAEPWR